MGTSGGATTSKSNKESSPAQYQSASFPYPEWTQMQVYYGHGVAIPPYVGAAVASGRAPHPFMWGPQLMMPPFMSPFNPIYAHHGVHPQVSMPLVPQTDAQGVELSSTKNVPVLMAIPLRVEIPAKVARNKATETTKKPRRNGRNLSDNGNAMNGSRAISGQPSGGDETEGSSDASHGHIELNEDDKAQEIKLENAALLDQAVNSMALSVGTPDFKPSMQDERAIRREKRKQSNRESAKRSRLRKLAETEELSVNVQTLSQENNSLRSEISQLKEKYEKLHQENLALVGRLEKNLAGMLATHTIQVVETDNLLSRINGLSSGSGGAASGGGSGKPGDKFQISVDPSRTAHIVAAG